MTEEARSGSLTLAGLEDDGIDTVVLAAADMQGRLLGRRLPAHEFARRSEVHLCSCVLAWDARQSPDVRVEIAGFHTGWHDWRLVADLDTLRPLPWLPATAFCTGDLVDEETHDPVAVAPRAILRRQVEALAEHGLAARVATELEFFLYRTPLADARLRGYRELEPTTSSRADYAIRQGNEYEWLFGEVRRALAGAGIPIAAAQVEWGHGQWEINLPHDEPLATADGHSLFKLAVGDISSAHGLAVTFMARPSGADVGSSCHVHLSLADAEGDAAFRPPDGDAPGSGLLRHALGGVLAHLDEAMLFYAPTINSYRRTSSDGFAGHGRTWGYDNRTVSCRVLGRDPTELRLELRVPGADVNPYLALAAVLASVVDGVERELDPGRPTLGNAYEQDRERLPADLGAATETFAASEWARRAFGADVVDHYAAVARHECAQFAVAVTDWELDRYFEVS